MLDLCCPGISSIISKLEYYEAKSAQQQVYFNATITDPYLKRAWIEVNSYDGAPVL